MDTYERTYSQLLDSLLLPGKGAEQEANDHAIACALAEEGPAAKPVSRPDTSLDEQLALQLYEKEVDKLVRPPEVTRRHRKRRGLHRLLRHLHFTRVIPRVNPVLELSDTYISQDRERLLLRLNMYALQERQVVGDGSCQFRAIADQLWFDQHRHQEVRSRVVEQLCQQPERYKDYVTTDYQQYVSSMSTPGTWGDHVTLQAAADAFNVRICIVSSFLENCVISINPANESEEQQQQPAVDSMQDVVQQLVPTSPSGDKTVWLAFWAEVHYNSLTVKPPESPGYSSDDSGSESGSSESGSARRREKLLGSKKLMHAADVLVPSKLRS